MLDKIRLHVSSSCSPHHRKKKCQIKQPGPEDLGSIKDATVPVLAMHLIGGCCIIPLPATRVVCFTKFRMDNSAGEKEALVEKRNRIQIECLGKASAVAGQTMKIN